MKNKMKLFLSLFAVITLLLTTYQSAEAANPIKPSQSRVTYTIKDANGVAYKVYFKGLQEKKAKASPNDFNAWNATGFNTKTGDQLYRGNYSFYTHKVGTSHIKTTKTYYKNYVLNTTTKSVYIYPSRYKGQPDLLAISKNEDYINYEGYFDSEESTDLYYMRNGVLTYLVAISHDRRMMNTGKNKFLFPNYLPGYGTLFHEFFFDPKTNDFAPYDVEPKNTGSLLKNWKKHWQ